MPYQSKVTLIASVVFKLILQNHRNEDTEVKVEILHILKEFSKEFFKILIVFCNNLGLNLFHFCEIALFRLIW